MPARLLRQPAKVLVLLVPLVAWTPPRCCAAAPPPPARQSAYPAAEDLLESMLAGLPSVPLRVMAQILSRDRGGSLEGRVNAEMLLDWHGRSPSAKYTIRDAFGTNLEGLNVRWLAGGKQQVRYFRGERLVATALPDLDSAVAGTDLSWIDLSLAFLWWKGGRTVGAERIKGRFCYMVDLPAPPDGAGRYAAVRLWVDPEIRILLQAAAYDRAGALLKVLEVKSFKKVGGVWVIQNVDVVSQPSRHKTSLRVRQAEAPGSPAPAPRKP